VECGAPADSKASRHGFGFCADCHRTLLAAVREQFTPQRRSPRAATPVTRSRVDREAQAAGERMRAEREAARTRQDAHVLQGVVRFVTNAGAWPVRKATLREAFPRPSVLDRAIKAAVDSGQIKSIHRGPLSARGYYPSSPSKP
jgi:hypothetical protein